MSDPYLTEIRMASFNFAPKGWALCNGQLLPINQNQAMFSLLGTTYGGNGQTNFALPNLRGRTPISEGAVYALGEAAGTETVTLNINNMAAHSHGVAVDMHGVASDLTASPAGHALAAGVANQSPGGPSAIGYFGTTPAGTMAAQSVGNMGGSQPHTNMQPYLAINFIIALQGIFPSQT